MSSVMSYLPQLFGAASTMLSSGKPRMKSPKKAVPEDATALKKARRRSTAEQAARSGRASTILTNSQERLGN